MTPALRQQQARTRMRAADIDINREKIVVGIHELRTQLRSTGPVSTRAEAILARIDAAADSIERATLALEGYANDGQNYADAGDAIKRLTKVQYGKAPAETGAELEATTEGDCDEHAD